MKKLFAILMSIMMIACFMPTMAFAAETVSVNEVTVSGKKDSDIGSNVMVTITLGNEGTFVETASMTGNWIQNLPSGLSQSVARGSLEDNKQATITITGVPTEVKEEKIQIIIPAANIDGQDSDLSIPQNDNVKFEILEEIEVPTVTPITYDGTEKTALVDGTGYKVSDTVKATNVGTVAYTATVTLLPGYRWKDLDEGEKNKPQSVTWNLQKKNPEPADFTFKSVENLSYDGQPKTAELKLNSPYTECGAITLKYAKKTAENSYDTPIEQAPDAVGTYKVTARVAGGDNFNPREVTDESWTFKITKAANQIAAPTPKGDLTYTGVAQDLVTKPTGVSCDCKVQYAVEKVTEAAAAAEKQWSEAVPQAKDAGKYNVYYKIDGCANHEGVKEKQVGSEPIVIKQKPVAYTIQVADKVYDGTDTAEIKADTTPETKDVAEADAGKVSLDLSNATATFADANAAENAQVDVKDAALTGDAAANYKLSAQPTATATISKAPLTITDATIAAKTYDKTTTATVNAVTFEGLVTVKGKQEELTKDTDYTVAGVFNDANVDKANSVTVTVTLISDKAKNYTIESFKKDAKIVPADKTDTTASVTVKKETKGLVALSDKIAEGATIGDITIQEGKAEWFAGDADAPKVVNGNLSFKLTDKATTGEQSNTATLTIPVNGATNYKNYEIVVTVKASEDKQEAVVIPPVAKTGLVYNGTDQALVTAGATSVGTLQYSLEENKGYTEAIPEAKKANESYTVYYKVVDGEQTVAGNNATGHVTVKIAQKPVTVQPKSFTIKQGDGLPTLGLEYVGLIGEDKLTVGKAYQPAFKYMQGDKDVTDPKEVGTYTIKWTNANAANFTNDNYQVETKETATLTIEEKSSGSSGGSYYPYTPSTPSTPAAPNLDKTKTDSTTALNAAATANKYDAAEQAEVKKILDKANADIKNAKTEAEVKAIEEAAQAEIDKILTTEEKAIVAALDNVEKRDFATKSKVITRKGGKKVIRLTWTAPDGVDVDGYEIFRSTKKNSGFGKKPYFTTSNTSYTNTKDLKAGKTYYYKVRAFVVINGERVYTDYSLKANRKL